MFVGVRLSKQILLNYTFILPLLTLWHIVMSSLYQLYQVAPEILNQSIVEELLFMKNVAIETITQK